MHSQNAINNLLSELEKLPGIGPKSATRIAYFLVNENRGDAISLAHAIEEVKETVHFCKNCFNYSQGEVCPICADKSRDQSIICVVAEPKNIPPIERTGAFKGLYHVLGGEISPMDGVSATDLHIDRLIERVKSSSVKEVLVATNPNIEGELTANWIANELQGLDVVVTRPASGIPVGGEIEFADEMTLARAIDDRKVL